MKINLIFVFDNTSRYKSTKYIFLTSLVDLFIYMIVINLNCY